MSTPRLAWTVLLPMRAMPNAKSRLAIDLPAELHHDLVTAIRADTLAAVQAAAGVARVVVVADEPGEGVALVQTSDGLNGALRDGFRHARLHWADDGIVALVGDLPALTGDQLAAALDAAAQHPSSFVPDTSGTGTTLLAVTPGTDLEPRFGAGSAARHAEVATAIDGGPGLRQDVDTVDELLAAAALGVGPHTTATLAPVTEVLTRSPRRGMMSP